SVREPIGARFVGQPIRRREDPRFLLGDTLFVDDVQLPGCCHVAFLRSPYAHALIKSVNLEQTFKHSGFVSALTGEALRKLAKPIRCDSTYPEFKGADWPAIAYERVRYAGEIV